MWWGCIAQRCANAVPHASDHWLSSSDGVRLCCRVWLPDGKGPWPVLLMRQPYGRAIASTVTYAHPQWYASRGYAVAVQDVRGRGDSEGVFAGFAQEAHDGSATLAWLRQQSWCSGRIGCYGFSYQGLSQLLLSDPNHLPDALAPAMAGLDERLHWASEGGCHWWALGVGWGLQLAAQQAQRTGNRAGWQEIREAINNGSFLSSGAALLHRLDPNGMAARWLASDPASEDGWICHQPPEALWRRPMLLVGGWHDPHLRGVLDLWQRSSTAGGEPWLHIGAWSHLNWQGGIDQLQLRFFDQHLKGLERSTPHRQLQDLGHGSWQARDPHTCSGHRWTLQSNGLAAVNQQEGVLDQNGSGNGEVDVVHDPWRPLPGRGGHLGLDAGSCDRTDLDQRSDVACFTSAAVQEGIELFGEPCLKLRAAADQPGFDLCVALSVVRRDGSVLQCSSGVARWLGQGCMQNQDRDVRLQPLLLNLEPGERLRLSIGLAAWPQIAVNPGNGSMPIGPSGPDHRVISVRLDLGDAELSIKPMVGAD